MAIPQKLKKLWRGFRLKRSVKTANSLMVRTYYAKHGTAQARKIYEAHLAALDEIAKTKIETPWDLNNDDYERIVIKFLERGLFYRTALISFAVSAVTAVIAVIVDNLVFS